MKLIKIKTLLILISAYGMLSSCNYDDAPDFDRNTNFLDYQVFYNSDLNETKVLVEFKKEGVLGSNIKLKEGESITFEGDELLFDESSTSYSKDIEGLITDGDFIYTSAEGKVYTSSLMTYESIDFPQTISSISKSEDLMISWVGEPLDSDENVDLMIGFADQQKYYFLFHEGEGTTSLQLESSNLMFLNTGKLPAYMDRGKQVILTDVTSAGGRIVTRYKSNTIEVDVTD